MIRKSMVIVGMLAIAVGVVFAAGPTFVADTPIGGSNGFPPAEDNSRAIQVLQRGDFIPEIGIGCSNGYGTSGGPNDLAVGVVATVATPFWITSATYNLFTQISPNMTMLNFAVWSGGNIGAPGVTLTTAPLTGFAQGDHTYAFPNPAPTVAATSIAIGVQNTQTNVGFRLGVDTSSSDGTSWIRAAGCGAAAFTLMDNIGYPGNWVVRAVANDVVPVELMTLSVK